MQASLLVSQCGDSNGEKLFLAQNQSLEKCCCYLWDLKTRQYKKIIIKGAILKKVVLSSDGKCALLLDESGILSWIDLESCKLNKLGSFNFRLVDRAKLAINFNLRMATIVIASRFYLYDLNDNKEIVVNLHENFLSKHVAFSPCDRWIAIYTLSHEIHIWDLQKLKENSKPVKILKIAD